VKIIVDRYNAKDNPEEYSYPRVVTCDDCGSEFEIDYEDTYIGALGCRNVRCPCCNSENMIDDGIQLTKDNLRFPDHYFHYDNAVELSNELTDKYVRECIETLRKYKDKGLYAVHGGTGDTHTFVFRYDDDEKYFVYVGKGGYETNVPFEYEDYK